MPDPQDQLGFPGGPPLPPYGVQSAPPPPPAPPAPPAEPPTPTPPPAHPSRLLLLIPLVLVVAIVSAYVAWPTGHSSKTTQTPTPTTLIPPSHKTFPAQTPADLAACATAFTTAPSPLPSPQASPAGDLATSGIGQIGKLAWAIPMSNLDNPKTNQYSYYVLASISGVVVVTNATVGMTVSPSYTGLSESTGKTLWSITLPAKPAAPSFQSDPPVLSGNEIFYPYQDATTTRIAGINLTTGHLANCYTFSASAGYLNGVFPVGDGLYATVATASSPAALTRLSSTASYWSLPGTYDSVIGGDASTLLVGQNMSSLSGEPVILGVDAGTGKIRWRESVKSITKSPLLHSYDTSSRPNSSGQTTTMGFDGSSVGLLDGVSQDGTTSFLWSPSAGFTKMNAPTPSTYLFTINNDNGSLAWGGWVAASNHPLMLAGAGHIWAAAGSSTSPEWLRLGAGSGKAFPAAGYQASANADTLIALSAATAQGSDYPTNTLSGLKSQLGSVPLETQALSSSDVHNGSLSLHAWTVVASYNTVKNITSGRQPDRAIVSYQITSKASPSPSPSPAPTVPPSKGGGGGKI